MKIAIIGAAGKTGTALVREALKRGHQVVAVCRTPSADRLQDFAGHEACTVITAPVVSDAPTLTQALAGCDGAVSIMISVRKLKATDLVKSLATAAAANGVTRLAFTAGEVTVTPEPGETLSLRQRIMARAASVISLLTPFSMTDMIQSSTLIRRQPSWNWTIVRAPTLNDKPATGYRFCDIQDVTAKHALSRADYAASLLDTLDTPDHHRRTLTIVPDEG